MPGDMEFSSCALRIVSWYAEFPQVPTLPELHVEVKVNCDIYGIWYPFDSFELRRYMERMEEKLMWQADYGWQTRIADDIKPILMEMDAAERGEVPEEEDVEGLTAWILEKLQWVIDQLKAVLTPIWNEVVSIVGSIGVLFDTWFHPITGIVPAFISDAIAGVMNIFDLETGFIGRKIAGTLDAVIGLGSDIGNVINSVLNIPSYLRAAANSFLKTILDNLELILDKIVSAVKSALGSAYQWVVDQLKKVIAYVVDGFMSIINKARAGLDRLIITATTFINGRLDSVFNWLSTTYDRFKNAAIELLEEIYASMLAVFKLAVDELVAIPAELNLDIFNLIGGFTDIFDEFKRWLEEFLSIDTDTISGLVTQLIPLVDKPQQVAKT